MYIQKRVNFGFQASWDFSVQGGHLDMKYISDTAAQNDIISLYDFANRYKENYI